MTNGFPLNDLDRHDWLLSIKKKANLNRKTQDVIIACSALKKKYRDFLSSLNFKLVYLKIDPETAAKRIANRKVGIAFPRISTVLPHISKREPCRRALRIPSGMLTR